VKNLRGIAALVGRSMYEPRPASAAVAK